MKTAGNLVKPVLWQRMRTGSALRVVRLTVPLRRIERQLASDVTSGRRDDLREAAASNAAAEGAGVADVVISNDRPVAVVARDVMTFPGWLWAAGHARSGHLRTPPSVLRDRVDPGRIACRVCLG